ncbi:hypothetical protein, partial [Salmonella enterica]|uniref:hypothetical protein n=1 Tax=Salmonella enterica TaxID=28901 RepID=UPI001BAEA432
IASRQRRKINFNIARTFWPVPLLPGRDKRSARESYSAMKKDTMGQPQLSHVLPLMFDNI